jgi:hypothetical protein
LPKSGGAGPLAGYDGVVSPPLDELVDENEDPPDDDEVDDVDPNSDPLDEDDEEDDVDRKDPLDEDDEEDDVERNDPLDEDDDVERDDPLDDEEEEEEREPPEKLCPPPGRATAIAHTSSIAMHHEIERSFMPRPRSRARRRRPPSPDTTPRGKRRALRGPA